MPSSRPNHQSTLLAAAVCILGSTLAPASTGAPESTTYTRARNACVDILVNDRHAGSGWIATRDGRVLTAAHVVEATNRLQVLLPITLQRADAILIARDRGHDLALLQIVSGPTPFNPLRLASKLPKTGDEIFLFGSPIFRHTVLLSGHLARSQPTFEYYGNQQSYIQCLHVSAIAPGGVSGGPWLNSKGEVIGLQSGAMTIGPSHQGVAFMIPLHAIARLLTESTDILTATLGIAVEETWQQDRPFLDTLPPGTDGLVIRKIDRDGAASRAGLRQMEIIVNVDGLPLRTPDDLLNHVRGKRPGATVELGLLDRTGTTHRQVTATLLPL